MGHRGVVTGVGSHGQVPGAGTRADLGADYARVDHRGRSRSRFEGT